MTEKLFGGFSYTKEELNKQQWVFENSSSSSIFSYNYYNQKDWLKNFQQYQKKFNLLSDYEHFLCVARSNKYIWCWRLKNLLNSYIYDNKKAKNNKIENCIKYNYFKAINNAQYAYKLFKGIQIPQFAIKRKE